MTETKEGKEGSLRCQAARDAAGAGEGRVRGRRHSTESLCIVFEELMRKGEGGARWPGEGRHSHLCLMECQGVLYIIYHQGTRIRFGRRLSVAYGRVV